MLVAVVAVAVCQRHVCVSAFVSASDDERHARHGDEQREQPVGERVELGGGRRRVAEAHRQQQRAYRSAEHDGHGELWAPT